MRCIHQRMRAHIVEPLASGLFGGIQRASAKDLVVSIRTLKEALSSLRVS